MSDSDYCLSEDDITVQAEEEVFKKDMETKFVEQENYYKMVELQSRIYQIELVEHAKQQNIIVCLPTGSGKTQIALELTRHMLPNAIKNQHKIVFVANSRPLVGQQAERFVNLTNNKVVKEITGDLNVDYWTKNEWDDTLAKHQILVATTQIILDAITRNFVNWNEIDLLILDECHHAQKGHAMAQLMKLYKDHQIHNGLSTQSEIGSKGVPRILGLTATIINTGRSEAEFIERDIEQVENRLCCKAYTHKNYEDVLKYSTSTVLRGVPFTTTHQRGDLVCEDITKLVEMLKMLPRTFGTDEEISIMKRVSHPSLTSEEQIYDKKKGVPEKLASFLKDLLETYEELGPYCSKLAARLKIIHLLQWILKLQCQSNIVPNPNFTSGNVDEVKPNILMLLESAKTALFQFIKKLDDLMNENVKGIIIPSQENIKKLKVDPELYKLRHCVSNKVEVLWKNLAERKPKTVTEPTNEIRFCGIIFCKKRITAQVLRWYLEEASNWELDFIKPEVMLGQSTVVEDAELARFSADRQKEILEKFKTGHINLLVATQVIEEGLDVPACSLVIRFDKIESYPSFVQSLGRARIKGAVSYALTNTEIWEQEKKRLENFEKYNKTLAAVLEAKANHVGENYKEEIDLETYEDYPIPPFKPTDNPTGSMVTAMEAVSLVYKYCDGLSCDRISTLAPVSWNEERIICGDGKEFKARVLLPILSPVRQVVEGDWMANKTLAKRSAFLKSYERLWEARELNEYLLPKTRSIENYKCQFLENLKIELKEEIKFACGKIGSRKRTQWYRKREPSIFRERSSVETNFMSFVYRINIQINAFAGDKSIENLYKFDNHGIYFGIVTNTRLENLPSFTLKAHFGIFNVSLEQVYLDQNTFSFDQLGSLKKFQDFICRFVFDIHNVIFEHDPEQTITIAPLNVGTESTEIDWKLIQETLDLENDPYGIFKPPSDESRNIMKFDSTNYVKLLVPWYKKDYELSCTLSVTNLDARSSFPKSNYSTYENYISEKYGVKIFHPEYPLIHYKVIGKQLNFLTTKVDSYERKEGEGSDSLMIIPELVNVHVLPASLYVQGKFLPSVLHRIYRLLVANELRVKVGERFNWNVTCGNYEEMEVDDLHYISDGIDSNFEKESFPEPTDKEKFNLDEKMDQKEESIIFLLESINLNEVDWETIHKLFDRLSIRDTNLRQLLDPPTEKSNAYDLIDIKTVKSYQFDNQTDFTVEKGPSNQTIMEALTLSNAQDNISLEKLEVMGDSVLKLIASLHVFHSFPNWDEGKLTQLRKKLISNLHLYQIGKKHGLGERLSGSIFIPNTSWLPNGFTIPKHLEKFVLAHELDYSDFQSLPKSSLNNFEVMEHHFEEIKANRKKSNLSNHTTYTHSRIGDKSVADCVEALIGAYFQNGGLDSSFRIMDYLGMRGPLEDGRTEKYSRESTMPSVEATKLNNISNSNDVPIPFVEDLEKILQYEFKNKWILLEALTHSTFMESGQTRCYQRLEFVGDAILDFLVTNYILKETRISDPGKITDLRMALVNNVTFACHTVRYGLHKFLRYHSERLKHSIDQFVVFDDCKLLSDSECLVVQEINAPKALGDLFESIAGAVFVDIGNSIDTVWKVFYRLMKNEFENFSSEIPKAPLRELHEKFHGIFKFEPLLQKNKNSEENAATLSHFHVYCLKVTNYSAVIGVGTTIKQAKLAAAKVFVRKLRYPDRKKIDFPSNNTVNF